MSELMCSQSKCRRKDEHIAELKAEIDAFRDASLLLTGKLEDALAELAELRGLLKIARCPNTECCLGSIPHQVGDHEWIAQQCQFCHERELLQEKGG